MTDWPPTDQLTTWPIWPSIWQEDSLTISPSDQHTLQNCAVIKETRYDHIYHKVINIMLNNILNNLYFIMQIKTNI